MGGKKVLSMSEVRQPDTFHVEPKSKGNKTREENSQVRLLRENRPGHIKQLVSQR